LVRIFAAVFDASPLDLATFAPGLQEKINRPDKAMAFVNNDRLL
jgi:hypothetical protein